MSDEAQTGPVPKPDNEANGSGVEAQANPEPSRPTPVVLECPDCFSHRAEIVLAGTGKKAKARARCADCGTAYDIKTVSHLPADNPEPEEEEEEHDPSTTAAKGKRSSHTHRKKSEEAPEPLPPPNPEDLGQLTKHIDAIIGHGPEALITAERAAAKLSKRFGTAFEQKWFLMTPFLAQLIKSSHRATRQRARYAIKWRPRYLATLAVTGSKIAAARSSGVAYQGFVARDMKEDPDFCAQVEAAKEYCKELLRDRMMQRALEGDCEPILYMGVPVAYVRKFDTRLQVEMARALMPDTFRTPGQHGAPVTNNTQNILVMDSSTAMALAGKRRAALEQMRDAAVVPHEAQAVPVEVERGGRGGGDVGGSA